MADIFGAFGAGRSGPGRYKKPASSRKILGVQATPTLTVIDDASAGGETAGWTKNIDYTSYSYGAVISLVNGTGATRYLSTVQVRGKPVEMLQGDEGLIHDAFQDHDSIYENGERKVEWGNDSIVTMAQTNQVADFLWKEFRSKKHVYMLSLPGTRYNYEPGDWYWLQIGGVGQPEYLDSLVQVYQVETYRAAAELGSTMIILKEVQEAWKKDSTAYARFIASGRTYNRPAQFNGIFIGSQYSTDKCDVYCDGVSDEDEINVAITDLSERYGGGIVHLSRGTFNIDGVITLKAGVILEGEGNSTIIEKNCNDYAIECDGASGSEIENSGIRNLLVTCNANDTNDIVLIYIDYADNFLVNDIRLKDAYADGIEFRYCDRGNFSGIIIDGFGSAATQQVGMLIVGGSGVCSDIFIDGKSAAKTSTIIGFYNTGEYQLSNVAIENLNSSGIVYGAYIDVAYSNINNIAIKNIDGTGAAFARGIGLTGGSDNSMINGIKVIDIDNTNTAANSYGIQLEAGCDNCTLTGILIEGCSGTGMYIADATCDRNILVGRSTNNGTNLTDNGTNTNKAAFDAT